MGVDHVHETDPEVRRSIAYLSVSRIPSDSANSIQVVKMSAAMRRLGFDVTLHGYMGPDSNFVDEERIAQHYGVPYGTRYLLSPVPKGRLSRFVSAVSHAISVIRLRPAFTVSRSVVGALLSSLAGIPTALELHHPLSAANSLDHWLFRFLTKTKSFKLLVVITQQLRGWVKSNFPKITSKILCVPDGADPIPDPLFVPPRLEARPLQVGYAGSFFPGKGVDFCVELSKLRQTYRFHILGGNHRDLFRAYGVSRIPPNLMMHPRVPPSEVPEFLLKMDVLLLPNFEQVMVAAGTLDIGPWTSPLKLFEYMASGRAIVCSKLPPLMEIGRQGENMILVDAGSPAEWATALDQLNMNPSMRVSVGLRARKQLTSQLTWSARAEKIVRSMTPSG